MGMRNPFEGYPITDDWAAHRARGSLGGTDFGTPVGTPIYAPNPGRVTYEAGNGSGGYIITLDLGNSPGYKMQFLHCSAFNGSDRNVSEGELLGYTGGAAGSPGAGSSTGAHVHVHLVDPNGVREDVMPWFENSSPAPTPGPASTNVDYVEVQTLLAQRGYYGGAIDGQFGPQSWSAVQTLCADFGFYDADGHGIDGVPGPATYTGMQMYAAKNDNYRGTIDGIIGPNTWAGFTQSLREDAPKPTVAPTPTPTTPVVEKPKPVVKPKPVTKPKPTRPTTTNKPNKETKPMPTIKPLPTESVSASHDALGILIPKSKYRRLAYALYGLTALIVSNVSVAIMAGGIQAPVWLIMLTAVVGNLAVPFTTLAIANASTTKK